MSHDEMGPPGHPGLDQLEAAHTEVLARAAQLPPSTAVFRVGPDALPEQLHQFARLHYGEFTDRTLRMCEHGRTNARMFTVVPGFAPNVLLCDQCAPLRLVTVMAQRRHAGTTGTATPCNVCGVPEQVAFSRQFALVIGHVLVLGYACVRCLRT